jgi:hypothetical protein
MAIVTGTIVVGLVLLGQHYVLNSAKLDNAIKSELPPGTPRVRVIAFIETRHPVAYDDMGAQLKARLQGLRFQASKIPPLVWVQLIKLLEREKCGIPRITGVLTTWLGSP